VEPVLLLLLQLQLPQVLLLLHVVLLLLLLLLPALFIKPLLLHAVPPHLFLLLHLMLLLLLLLLLLLQAATTHLLLLLLPLLRFVVCNLLLELGSFLLLLHRQLALLTFCLDNLLKWCAMLHSEAGPGLWGKENGAAANVVCESAGHLQSSTQLKPTCTVHLTVPKCMRPTCSTQP
jgi:hypothetical protein